VGNPRFRSRDYAAEELRAELASVFISAQLGIPADIPNHASYVDSWLKALRGDRREIFRAAADAQRISDWCLACHPDYAAANAGHGNRRTAAATPWLRSIRIELHEAAPKDRSLRCAPASRSIPEPLVIWELENRTESVPAAFSRGPVACAAGSPTMEVKECGAIPVSALPLCEGFPRPWAARTARRHPTAICPADKVPHGHCRAVAGAK
jgi:hypothetical protein